MHHRLLLRTGTEILQKQGKKKPDQMCCSFEEPSFSGHCGSKDREGEGG